MNDIENKVLRNSSGSYQSLGQDKNPWADQESITAFTMDVILLKRPVFERAGKALLPGMHDSVADLKLKFNV